MNTACIIPTRMRRGSCLSLDGEWDFEFSREMFTPSVFDMHIEVPFPPESEASGVACWHSKGTYLNYRKIFSLPLGFKTDGEVLLHFGAISPQADVWLNGKFVGSHYGSDLPFSFSVAHLLKQENVLCVRVYDERSAPILYGRERRRISFGESFSGIWQSVTLEHIPKGGIYGISVTASDTEAKITVDSTSKSLAIRYEDGEEQVTLSFTREIVIRPKSIRPWSPEEPNLYPFTVFSPTDEVTSYFALRRFESREENGVRRFYLNGHAYPLHGVLDNGFFEGGISAPTEEDGYSVHIESIKALGFNAVRRHKILAAPAFYEACDRLGLIVFQDVAFDRHYAFRPKHADPVSWFEAIHTRLRREKSRTKEIFRHYIRTLLEHLSFYPSLCLLTVYNEELSTLDARHVYAELKPKHPQLLLSLKGRYSAEGQDAPTDHLDAAYKGNLSRAKKPVILTGVGDFTASTSKKSRDSVQKRTTERFVALYEKEVIPALREGAAGCIFTQLKDSPTASNGIYTVDGKTCRIEKKEALRISSLVRAAFEK